MGFGDFLSNVFGGKKKAKKRKEKSSKPKKELPRRIEVEEAKAGFYPTETAQPSQTMSLTSLKPPEQQVYSPAVEHPMLTIQDRISKLEETFRGLSDQIRGLDAKVATKEDVDDIKVLLHEDLVKEDKILVGITGIHQRIGELEEKRGQLTRRIGVSTEQLTQDAVELTRVEVELDLLDADRKVLDSISTEPKSTIELQKELGYSRQYLWERLKVLEKAGYARSERVGRQTKYSPA